MNGQELDGARLVICECGRVVRRVFATWSQWAPRVECECDPDAIKRRAWFKKVRAFAHGVALSTRPGRARRVGARARRV